jgi:hypothetical protein
MLHECATHNIVVNLCKSQLVTKKSIVALGSVISHQQISIDPERIMQLSNYPVPASKEQCLRAMGLFNYLGANVPNLQTRMVPLRDAAAAFPFRLSQAAEDAFKGIVADLINAVPRVIPAPGQHIRLFVDSSDIGIGAVVHDDAGQLILVYDSLLNPAQRNYDALGKELTALTKTLRRFPYLFAGRPATAFTDHLNIARLDLANHTLNPRVARGLIFLKENFPELKIVHWPGALNVAADALSRAFICAVLGDAPAAADLPTLLIEQRDAITAGYEQDKHLQELAALLADPTKTRPTTGRIAELLRLFERNEQGLLLHKTPSPTLEPKRVVIPAPALFEVLTKLHESKGHPGAARLVGVFNQRLFAFSVDAEARRVVKACMRCATNKHSTQAMGALHPDTPMYGRWVHVVADTVMALPEANSVAGRAVNQILLVLDTFTGYVVIVPIHSSFTSQQFISTLHERVFAYFGIPLTLLVDRQSQFTSEVFISALTKLGVTVNHVATNHHVGKAEIKIKELRAALRIATELDDKTDWPLHLSTIEYNMNALPSKRHGVAPFTAALGYIPRGPAELLVPAASASIAAHQALQRAMHNRVSAQLTAERAKLRDIYDRNRVDTHFVAGDRVLVHSSAIAFSAAAGGPTTSSVKMKPTYLGPFTVLEETSKTGITVIKLPQTSKANNKIALQFLRLAPPAMGPTVQRLAMPAVEQPEVILNRRQTPAGAEYFVKYQNLSIDHARWIPALDV